MKNLVFLIFFLGLFLLTNCHQGKKEAENALLDFRTPSEIIDLGGLVTEDLPERVWGKALMPALGFNKSNNFEVIEWEFEMGDDKISGSNAYYTIFNHGGPHIDAPSHMDVGGGLDSYPIEAFLGPLKVFDVSQYSKGHTVPVEVFRDKVLPGEVVLIYTRYIPPQTDNAFPEVITLTHEAAEYLANIPVRAYGTDAFSVMSSDDTIHVESDSEAGRAAPVHYPFLSRGIPIYEGLYQIENLLDNQDMYFIGVPLNIKDGDGILVRPLAFKFQSQMKD